MSQPTISGYPDFIADEDMQIVLAVVRNLLENTQKFHINLPGGTILSNVGDTAGDLISMASLDKIQEGKQKLLDAGATEPFCIIMPTEKYKIRTKVGVMFNMEVYADPQCDSNNFLIQQMNIGA